MDLFNISLLKKIYKSRWFPLVFQIFTLIVFFLLIAGALGVNTNDMTFAKTLRNTNLANLIVWSYWWPLIIVTAVLIGRYWCTICPMELVTSVASKLGLKRKPGNLLKSGWVITFFYAIILIIGIHTFAIHRVPERMAIYMLILFGTALIAGLVWEKRTFCSHICPVGHLLGLYSLLASTEWRVKDPQVCMNCKTKECIQKGRQYYLTRRSCTSNLYPPKISDNRKCLFCSQCLSSCPNDNFALRLRKPLSDFVHSLKLSFPEIGFIVIVSGFIIYEVLSEWSVTEEILLFLPNRVSNLFGITGIWIGTVGALILFILFPTFFFIILGSLRKVVSNETLRDSMSVVALSILPIMGSMHLLKAFLKMSSRIPYWTYIFQDPKGVKTAKAIIGGTLILNKGIVQSFNPFLTGIALLLPLVGFGFSFWFIMYRRKDSLSVKMVTLVAPLLYSGLFETGIVLWRVFRLIK